MSRPTRNRPSGGVLLTAGRSRHDRGLRAARRRRQIRRRRAAVALLVVAVAAAVLLVALPNKASGPVLARRAPARPAVAATPAPSTPAWSLSSAPPGEQVSMRVGREQLSAGMLFDVRTGQVLWALHQASALPIASLTKMMTALVVIAHSRLSDRVLITSEATHFSGSGVGLLPLGKRVPMLPLLYGLLLPSGNDAATALAQHVAGSQEQFIAMMNAQARAMGLRCSHFTTDSGLLDQGNYACSNDLAVMAHAVLEQPVLGQIVASPSAILPFPIKGGKLFLYNNNPLLTVGYPGADGVKTGYTVAAGQCLVAAARHGRTWLAVVLLHSANEVVQAEKLLNEGFARLRGRE